MGVQGLLPTLKSVMTPRHVRHYAGSRAAIDTYSWLHKAAFTCSKDLCQGRPNDKYVEYCMHRVNMLRHYGVEPVLVFDGGRLPMKSDQEMKRARSRKDNLERAAEHERLGNHAAAQECYQKAVDITPALALRLIKVLRQEDVEFVVAPYEADAQMALLALNGSVDLVITEDSDLIAYGCPQIFFKMDKYGHGVSFQFSDIKANKDLDFTNFSKRMILEMCIMSGCDYLPSLPGMGVKKAHGLIKRFKSYQKVLKHLKFNGVIIDQQYEQGFQRAVLTFQHHLVYDPARSEMVHLTEVPSELASELDFLGPYLSQTVATAIARGEVDPSTYEPFEDVMSLGRPEAYSNAEGDLAAPKEVQLPNFSQDSEKQVRALRRTTSNGGLYSSVSQEENGFRASPSPTLTSASYPSSFSRASFASEMSSTPPSQVSSFMAEEPDLDSGLSIITDLLSQNSPSFKEIPSSSEDVSPFQTSRSVEMKARRAFVPPSMKNGATQCTSVSVKRSGYFSRPAPSRLHGTSPEDLHQNYTCEASLWSTSIHTEGIALADPTECSNDVSNFPHVDKKQGILKDITNRGQSESLANGKRKYSKSEPQEERPTKSGCFSSVSHVGHLAQRSMNEFVSNMKPFQCSMTGCRASGLRAPPKNGPGGLRAPFKLFRLTSMGRNEQETPPVRFDFSDENIKTNPP